MHEGSNGKGWSTVDELRHLDAIFAGHSFKRLIEGHAPPDLTKEEREAILSGYAQHAFFGREDWGMIDRQAVVDWLCEHWAKGVIKSGE